MSVDEPKFKAAFPSASWLAVILLEFGNVVFRFFWISYLEKIFCIILSLDIGTKISNRLRDFIRIRYIDNCTLLYLRESIIMRLTDVSSSHTHTAVLIVASFMTITHRASRQSGETLITSRKFYEFANHNFGYSL